MEPITWSMIAGLIAQYGVPFVEQLLTNINAKTDPTPADWNALVAKIQTPFSQLVPKVGP